MGSDSEQNDSLSRKYLNEVTSKLTKGDGNSSSGNASLMIGAGFCKNADMEGDYCPPNWNELADAFYEKIHGITPEQVKKEDKNYYLSPLALANQVEAMYDRNVLEDIIRKKVHNDSMKPNDIYHKLLELPWKDIFTTNYDTLLEDSLNKVKRKYYPVYTVHGLIHKKSPRIIKLHGSYPDYGPFIITEQDYIDYPRKFAPFVNCVQQALIESTLVMLGFSGDDPNFLKWISWIKANFNEYSPSIYLIQYGNLHESHEILLRKRNIRVIYLSELELDPKGLIGELSRKYVESTKKQKWPSNKAHLFSPNTGLSKEIISQWEKDHKEYFGWPIAPEKNRRILWEQTQPWTYESTINHAKSFEAPFDLNFLYELNWRLEICLVPIIVFDLYFDLYNEILDRYDPFKKKYLRESDVSLDLQQLNWKKIQHRWLDLKIALLRYYREEEEWDEWKKLGLFLRDSHSSLSPEQKTRINKEYYLRKYFDFSFRDEAIPFPENDSIPHRVMIFASEGKADEAEAFLDDYLAGLRKAQDTHENAGKEASGVYMKCNLSFEIRFEQRKKSKKLFCR